MVNSKSFRTNCLPTALTVNKTAEQEPYGSFAIIADSTCFMMSLHPLQKRAASHAYSTEEKKNARTSQKCMLIFQFAFPHVVVLFHAAAYHTATTTTISQYNFCWSPGQQHGTFFAFVDRTRKSNRLLEQQQFLALSAKLGGAERTFQQWGEGPSRMAVGVVAIEHYGGSYDRRWNLIHRFRQNCFPNNNPCQFDSIGWIGQLVYFTRPIR